MRIAITGASGFVGRHVVARALERGHEVAALARREEAAQRLEKQGATVVRGELDTAALDALARGAGALVHLAHIGSERRGSFDAVNVDGTRAAIEAARRAGVPRVVLLSGLGVAHYGMTPRCTNDYFRSKLEAELALYGSGLSGVVLRPSYIVGPGDGLMRSLRKAFAARRVQRPGDGAYRMQPAAVRDAADAILAGAAHAEPFGDRPPHRVFDLVGPEPIAYDAFVARVADAVGVATYEVVPQDVAQADAEALAAGRRDDLDCLLCDEVADHAPLEQLLGRPLTSLDVAIRLALAGTAET